MHVNNRVFKPQTKFDNVQCYSILPVPFLVTMFYYFLFVYINVFDENKCKSHFFPFKFGVTKVKIGNVCL